VGKYKKASRVGAALAVLALVAAACGGSSNKTSTGGSGSSPAKTKNGGNLTMAIDETIPGWNILTTEDNEFVLQEVLNQVLPSPFIVNSQLQVLPDHDYVTSATETSTSPETIVYQLNPKAVWMDGTPINASDYIYNWQAQSGNPQYKDVGGQPFDVVGTNGYANIQSVTGSNGGHTVTVVFQKNNPFGDWQSLFGDLMPAHVAQKVGWNTGFNNYQNLVSGGPYYISNYVKDQTVTLSPNLKWWGAKPHLKTITFRILTDDTQGPTAMQNNEIQVFQPSSATKAIIDQTKALPNVTSSVIGGLEFEHIDFNESNPYLAKLQVRQAIAYGINRSDLVKRTVGQEDPSITPLGSRMFVPGQPEYKNNGAAYDSPNPAKAKQLLQSAGFTMGSDGYFQTPAAPGKPAGDLTFNLSTTSGQPLRQESEVVIQSDLKAIGIKINIANFDAATLFGTTLPKGEYDLAEFAWVSSPFASGNLSIYCSYTNAQMCGQNWIHYSDPKVDQLLQKAQTESTQQAASIYNQADQQLWSDMATLPLYQRPQLAAWSNGFANILPNASESGITWNAQNWAEKAS
jgi:peptide/nickel transport system substrate-binding protein